MAARRGSGEDLAHPNASAITPNGRVRSSSSARPAATCMPRRRASSSAASSRRVLPMPGSPSISATAVARLHLIQGLFQDRGLCLTPADGRDWRQGAHPDGTAPPGARSGSRPWMVTARAGRPPGAPVTSYSARSSPSQPVKPISPPEAGTARSAPTTHSRPGEARPCPSLYGSPQAHPLGTGRRRTSAS